MSSASSAIASLPVAVIGAGPVGLAAAVHLRDRGETPLVLEAGPAPGASIRAWGHVRLFSPWRYVVDAASVALLEAAGWSAPPPDDLPTGNDLVDRYLLPLAALPRIAPHLRFNTRVQAIARQGFDKLKTDGRDAAPFVLRVQREDGATEHILAKAVIDASGTWTMPNPLGANGLPALGEATLADRIAYGIPDVLGRRRDDYAGRRVLVAGSGHSAFNALLDLAELARQAPGTTIIWAIRGTPSADFYGGGAADAIPARGQLGRRLHDLVDAGIIRLVTGFRTVALHDTAAGIVVEGETGALPPVDRIIAATGFRPDLSLTGELRLKLDPIVESPAALAPLIDPNLHSCGTVPPHGFQELSHPEPGFYTAGMKSYGRAPTFLLLTGYEQVRSVVAALTGDLEAASNVMLTLPATGVCSSSPADSGDAACCATAAPAPMFVDLLELVPAPAPVAASACCGDSTPQSAPVHAPTAAAGASACCGGPAPDASAACCALDAEVKASGGSGCGCGTAHSQPVLAKVAPEPSR